MRNRDFQESAGYLRVSECHGAPCHKNRCTACGHRQAIGGVPPVESRKITMKKPYYPAVELYGRYDAKKQGKK